MTTVRLGTRLESKLERLAKQRGQSNSQVIRDALEHFAEEQETGAASALDRLRPFVGIADNGGQHLSKKTGERFREVLLEKQGARGSG